MDWLFSRLLQLHAFGKVMDRRRGQPPGRTVAEEAGQDPCCGHLLLNNPLCLRRLDSGDVLRLPRQPRAQYCDGKNSFSER